MQRHWSYGDNGEYRLSVSSSIYSVIFIFGKNSISVSVQLRKQRTTLNSGDKGFVVGTGTCTRWEELGQWSSDSGALKVDQ